jgi:hypothetical protein
MTNWNPDVDLVQLLEALGQELAAKKFVKRAPHMGIRFALPQARSDASLHP